MTQLYRVLYCSRNTLAGPPDTYPDRIMQILAKSRENNMRDNVTGGLLFSDGCFAQVLEGPIDMVEGAFERIQCDDRHGEVTVLQAGPIAARDFPNWSMAFTGSDDASPLHGNVLSEAFLGRSSAGDNMLGLMRKVVVSEHDWLAPV